MAGGGQPGSLDLCKPPLSPGWEDQTHHGDHATHREAVPGEVPRVLGGRGWPERVLASSQRVSLRVCAWSQCRFEDAVSLLVMIRHGEGPPSEQDGVDGRSVDCYLRLGLIEEAVHER